MHGRGDGSPLQRRAGEAPIAHERRQQLKGSGVDAFDGGGIQRHGAFLSEQRTEGALELSTIGQGAFGFQNQRVTSLALASWGSGNGGLSASLG